MSLTKEQIKEYTKTLGIDYFGVANVERFESAPEGKHPCDILPGCRSVLVLGIRLMDGVIQANFRAFEDGRADLQGIYGMYGYSTFPNFSHAYACYATAKYIEANTDEFATPCSTGPMTNGMQISIRHAAVAAGLGEFGYLGIVLVPEVGARVRFAVVLTTLELEPDPMYDGPPLCNQCGICARVCPTGAISMPGEGKVAHIEIGGKQYEYALINRQKCQKSLMAMTKDLGGREDYLTEKEPTGKDIAEAMERMPIESQGVQHHGTWHCGRCQSYCPVGNWIHRFKKTGLSKGAASVFINEKK